MKTKIRFIFIFSFLIIFSIKNLFSKEMTEAQAQVLRETFVTEVKKYVGSPYVYGAVGPDSFDCSGLVYYTAKKSLNIQLPRTSRALYSYCKIVPDSKREIGDLLFFKTNNTNPITHVGVYIGNNQFISAISDGPNTGVIISSLNQEYWKPKYVATGKFLEKGNSIDIIEENDKVLINLDEEKSSTLKNENINFKDRIIFDASFFVDWSLFSINQFKINFNGLDLQSNVRISKIFLEPGFGFSFRFNHALKVFQIPLLFSATVNDYFRFYAGPVFTIGQPKLFEQKINSSIFPGIIGVSFSTPSFNISKLKVQIVQDVSYTIFNNLDNSALSFGKSIASGLVFYTGFRVNLGLKDLR